MRASQRGDALAALVNGDCPISEETWRSFWDRLRGRKLRQGEALALVSSLSTRPPDAASVRTLLTSLHERSEHPARPLPGTVNIVGTGGGPSTFNISTAAAFVAATLGARVVKTGSRAYTSRCGSIDLLERLGVPLAGSYAQTERMLESFGIAFAGGFVYPTELRLLARSMLPFDMRTLGRFFNRFGPFLALVPVWAQLTGVSDAALLPTFRQLAAQEPDKRFFLSSNATGVDELVSFEENVIHDSFGARDIRLAPKALGLRGGSLEDLRPPADDASTVAHFIALLSGDGPPAAIESICLNAAAIAVACGVVDDWSDALRSAADAMDAGIPMRLIAAMRDSESRHVSLLR